METINNFFADLGQKMPFAADFFANNLKIGSFEINTLFLILVALVVVIAAVVVIAVCAASAKKKKSKANAASRAKMEENREQQKLVAKEADSDVLDIEPTDATPAVVVSSEPVETDEPEAEPAAPEVFDVPEAEQTAQAQPVEEVPEVEQTAQAQPVEEVPEAQQTAQTQPVEEVPVLEEVASETETDAAATTVHTQETQAVTSEDTNDDVLELDVASQTQQEAAAEVAQPQEEAPKASTKEENSDAPVAMEERDMKEKEVKKATAKEAPAEEKAKKALVGTFEVSLCLDGYRFCLYASNKQLMYESVGFTSSDGAMKGIETFRKTLQETPYIITHDKYGHYRYVFNKRYQGENYTSAAAAQSAAESVKRWAENAKVVLRNPKPEEKEAYKKGVESLRTKDDVDWDEVAKAEATERKMGKFTIEEEGNQEEVIGYRFYLIANNAQILYTSAIYTTAAGALKAIDPFKRAVYIGNFYVDEDKFGRYRYILRSNATTTYVGESYPSRSSAESSIESVKKFVKCATIIPFKKNADEE